MAVEVFVHDAIPAAVVLASVGGVPPILVELAVSEVDELGVEVAESVEGYPESQTVHHLHGEDCLEVGAEPAASPIFRERLGNEFCQTDVQHDLRIRGSLTIIETA